MENGIAKKCLGWLAACAVAVGMASSAWADTETVGGVQWTYTAYGDMAVVEGADPATGNLVIPSELGGCLVSEIGYSAFSDCTRLTGVTIPDSVTYVGGNAFTGCDRLKTLSVPGVWFGMNMLDWADVPESCEVVYRGIEQETVGGVSWTYRVSEDAATVLGASPAEGRLTVPSSLGGVPVRFIGERAFTSSAVEAVVLPDSVTGIRDSAFLGCEGLESASLGRGVEEIGGNAFSGCTALAAVEMGDAVTYIGSYAFNGTALVTVELPAGVSEIGYGTFAWCPNLVSVSMPGVEYIANWAFSECTSLESIVIPAGVAEIGESAFSGCTALAAYSVEEGNAAYSSASGVLFDAEGKNLLAYPPGRTAATYTIPAGVEHIVSGAFAECPALEAVGVAEGNGAYASAGGVLYSKDGAELVCWPKGKATGNVVVPPGTLRIADRVFEERDDLESVSLPAGLQRIGRYAFARTGLAAVELPEGLKRIEEGAFQVTGLETVTIPKSVKMTGRYAFSGCPLRNAAILGGAIAESAFEGCSSLESVTLGTLVSGINAYAFYWSGNAPETVYAPASWEGKTCPLSHEFHSNMRWPLDFTVVYYDAADDGEPSEEEEEYEDVWSYEVVDGSAVLNAGNVLGAGSAVGGKVVVPSMLGGHPVTAVGWHAFYGLSEISSMRLPDGVRSIEDEAFSGCVGLESLVIPASATRIGSGALSGCTNLASLYVPASWKGTGMLDDVWGWTGQPAGCTIVYDGGEPTEQRVAFDPNGGTCGTAAKTCAVGEAYGALPTAKRSGHVWLGWYTEAAGGERVTEDSVVTAEAERTLYAHWTDRQVTTFAGNGGKPATQATTNTIYADYGAFPEVKWSGHALVGWFNAAEGGKRVYTNSTVTLAAARTLYAQWTTEQVTTFKGNGGSPATQKTTNAIYAAYGAFPEATWEGHVFQGWFNHPTSGKRVYTNSTVTLAATRTLYAHWASRQVVTFNGNGGSPATQTATNTMGEAYGTLPTPKWSGHVFQGWFTAAAGGTEVTAADLVTPATARTLYAHWTDQQVTTFAGNGGKPATQATTNTIYADYGAFPEAKWSGHALVGWFTAPEGGKRVYTNSTVTLAAARTLYAQWTTEQVTTFKGNGGSPGTQKTTNTIYETYGAFPQVKWSGHALVGWFNAAEGGKRVYTNSTVTLAAARTLYAQWTTEQVTTFKGNGGTPEVQKTTNTIYAAYGTFPEATWEGHVFQGWFNHPTSGKRVYTNSTVTLAATRTLYAHWSNARGPAITGVRMVGAVAAPAARAARGGGAATLRFEAEAGVAYEIQWTPMLCTEWTTLEQWLSENGGETELEVELPAGAPTGFFRVLARGMDGGSAE